MKPVNVGSVDAHLTRNKAYMAAIPEENRYTRRDLEDKNLVWSFVNPDIKASSVKEYHQQLCAFIKDKTGRSVGGLRKMQDPKTGRFKEYNSVTCLWDMVVLIKENTTMEDMNNFIHAVQKRFGLTPVTVAIHRDEGHYEPDGEWVPNLHAHIVWDRIRHNGDNTKKAGTAIKLQKQDASALQEMAADILGMERGVSHKITHRRHLDRDEYIKHVQDERMKNIERIDEEAQQKQEEAEKKIERLEEQVTTIETNVKKKRKQAQSDVLTAVGNKVASLFGKGELAEKNKQIEKLEEQNKALKAELPRVMKHVEAEWMTRLEMEKGKVDREKNRIKLDYQDRIVSQSTRINQLENERKAYVSVTKTLLSLFDRLDTTIRKAVNAIINFAKSTRSHFESNEKESVENAINKYSGNDDERQNMGNFLLRLSDMVNEMSDDEWYKAKEEVNDVVMENMARGMRR